MRRETVLGVPTERREGILDYAAAVFNAFGPRNAEFDRGDSCPTPPTGAGTAMRERRVGHRLDVQT